LVSNDFIKNAIQAIERKPVQVIVGLFFFHITVACMMFWLAHSPFFSHLHNGQGFWNFAIDSTLYHKEAVQLVPALNSGDWSKWWNSSFGDDIAHQVSHAQVKWIALTYWVTGKEVPLLFELFNSVTWVSSVVIIYLAAHILFGPGEKVAGIAVLFLFFPSALLSSTQLLKDPFYTLGLCFVIIGWAVIFREEAKWNGVLAIIVGFLLITSTRTYVSLLLLSIFSICALISMIRKKIACFPVLVMLIGIFLIYFQYDIVFSRGSGIFPDYFNKSNNETIINAHDTELESNSSFLSLARDIWRATGEHSIENLKNKDSDLWHRINERQMELLNGNVKSGAVGYISYLNKKIAFRFSILRSGFSVVNRGANSKIDERIQFMNIRDLFYYFPRAVQIGFLSPFPTLWVTPGTQTMFIGRIITGLETIILYVIWVGFISAVFMGKQIWRPLVPVLLFSGIIIVLLGFVVPNVGAIYRMRQGLLIPFFMVGVYGVGLLHAQIKSAITKYESSKSV
jgi:hypothetical protein